MSKQINWRWGAVLLAGGVLAGCTELRISPDYGVAVRQDVAAQIADPDPHYTGDPQPGSNTNRVAAAQRRYTTGHLIQPPTTSTSSVASDSGGGSGGDSGSSGGGGNGGGSATGQ